MASDIAATADMRAAGERLPCHTCGSWPSGLASAGRLYLPMQTSCDVELNSTYMATGTLHRLTHRILECLNSKPKPSPGSGARPPAPLRSRRCTLKVRTCKPTHSSLTSDRPPFLIQAKRVQGTWHPVQAATCS